MSFDLRAEMKGEAPTREEPAHKEEFKSKHTYKIQENSPTVIVSFRFQPENRPDLSSGKIVHILRKIIQDNPLASAPRSYGHKFYLTFEERPRDGILGQIQRTVEEAFPACKVFVKRDEVTRRDLSTLYVGKMLGVDKQLMEEFL